MGERRPQYINEWTFKEKGSQELWVCSVQEWSEQRMGSHCQSQYRRAFISPVCDLSHSYRIIKWGLEAWSGEPAWQVYRCNTGEPRTLAAKADSHALEGLHEEERSTTWAHSPGPDLIPACRPLVTEHRDLYKRLCKGFEEGSVGKVLAEQAWRTELNPLAWGQKPGHSNGCLESQQWGGGDCWLGSLPILLNSGFHTCAQTKHALKSG